MCCSNFTCNAESIIFPHFFLLRYCTLLALLVIDCKLKFFYQDMWFNRWFLINRCHSALINYIFSEMWHPGLNQHESHRLSSLFWFIHRHRKNSLRSCADNHVDHRVACLLTVNLNDQFFNQSVSIFCIFYFD